MDLVKKDEFYREYDLFKARKQESKSKLELVSHQRDARRKLIKWFKTKHDPFDGGILALPTGGGKTLVAVRFLCEYPLSKGYKVLWLAHTHHLLEQAFFTFGPKYKESENGYEVGFISGDKEELKVRVVSGAKNNYPPKQIEESDDVIIGTLQTIRGAYQNNLKQFMSFLDSADDKLFVVFDEAHHAVAPSYRRLILDLRKRFPEMKLLGLTATPTAANENKRILLKKVFPQSVIAEATVKNLMREKILAIPKFDTIKTHFDAKIDFGDYQKWVNTYGDLPQKIIKDLAEDEDRNKVIADTYADKAEEFGKTIIFTDRWYQCVTLCTFLRDRNINADVMFNMVDKNLGTAGTAQRNLDVLEKFKKDEIDVLINIRMLTEGTDVPNAHTVFLTRQTTSDILLTQMIGRALRGPKFGGTEIAHIVSFIDNWEYDINWAEWNELPEGPDPIPPIPKKPPKVPLEWISIKLIEDAARRADIEDELKIASFVSLMPVGWYLTEFDTNISENGEFKSVKDFVLVFKFEEKDEKEKYENFMEYLKKEDLELFEAEDLEFNFESKESKYEKIAKKLVKWNNKFFSFDTENKDKFRYLFMITRHMAQNDKSVPQYFNFEERDNHDIDVLAQRFTANDLGPNALNQACMEEYDKKERYWKALYPEYIKFKSEVDYWITRTLNPIGVKKTVTFKGGTPIIRPKLTPTEIKRNILKRDNFQCLCCGEEDKRLLEIDHIHPRYRSTDDSEDNLQTLCKTCNKEKNIKNIDFHLNKCKLETAPSEYPNIKEIFYFEKNQVQDLQMWQKFLKRKINLFYECDAVKSISIGKRGKHLINWEVFLQKDNNPKWIQPFEKNLTQEIRSMREYYKLKGPEKIKIYQINKISN